MKTPGFLLFFTIVLLSSKVFANQPGLRLNSIVKMVIVWGEVNFGEPSETVSITWDECIQSCLQQMDCYLIENRNSECRLFSYGSAPMVLKKDKAYGTKVGFKRVLSTCPADGTFAPLFIEDNLPNGMTEIIKSSSSAYQITITSGTPGPPVEYRWTIYDRFFIDCPYNTIVSIRDANVYCIEIRLFPPGYEQGYNGSVDWCAANGRLGLTGPNSDEDRTNILAYYKFEWGIDTVQLWMDGTRSGTGNYQLTDGTLNSTSYNDELSSGQNKVTFNTDGYNCCAMEITETSINVLPSMCETPRRGALCKAAPKQRNF